MKNNLKLSELFIGIQGEGKTTGQPRCFIRTSGCNLNCWYCDTQYHKKIQYEINLNNKITLLKKDFLYPYWCITGGEPLLQQNQLIELIKKCKPKWIEIETNGTIKPKKELIELVDLWNISPKSPDSQPTKKYSKLKILKCTNLKDFIIKIVYTGKNKIFINKFKKYKDNVWIMPEGSTQKEQLKKAPKIMDYCLKNKYNYSPRLHVLIYGNKKGV